jgi:hypothetical protein
MRALSKTWHRLYPVIIIAQVKTNSVLQPLARNAGEGNNGIKHGIQGGQALRLLRNFAEVSREPNKIKRFFFELGPGLITGLGRRPLGHRRPHDCGSSVRIRHVVDSSP